MFDNIKWLYATYTSSYKISDFTGLKKGILRKIKQGEIWRNLLFCIYQAEIFHILSFLPDENVCSLSVIFQWLVLIVFCGIRSRLIETETWNCDCRFLIYTTRWRLCSLVLGHLVQPPVTCHIIPWLYGCECQSRGNLSTTCQPQLKREKSILWVK